MSSCALEWVFPGLECACSRLDRAGDHPDMGECTLELGLRINGSSLHDVHQDDSCFFSKSEETTNGNLR